MACYYSIHHDTHSHFECVMESEEFISQFYSCSVQHFLLLLGLRHRLAHALFVVVIRLAIGNFYNGDAYTIIITLALCLCAPRLISTPSEMNGPIRKTKNQRGAKLWNN